MSREHGTRAKYVVEKCRCDLCRASATAYARDVNRRKAYGTYVSYVDAEPARRHVRRLGAQGMGWKRVSHAAGLSPSTVWKLVYGDTKRYGRPSNRVMPKTAAAILSVELDLADGAKIDATGTSRRLRGLVAIGYSQSFLAQRIGVRPTNFGPLVHDRERVTVATARAVSDLYDELSMTPRVGTDHRTKISVSRARRYAERMKWLPPLAWDDDTIDDPFMRPETAVKVSRLAVDADEVAVQRFIEGDLPLKSLTPADRVEVVRQWKAAGRPLKELERRGMNPFRYDEAAA